MLNSNQGFKAIEVFSGCGGLSTGIKNAGFNVLCAIELNATAANTYKLNHPEVLLKVEDVCKINGGDLLKELNVEKFEVDLLAGCSPCQGFSRLQKKSKDSSDIRNGLILQFVRLVEEIMPKTIIMENVPGLIKSQVGLEIFEVAKQRLIGLGYKLDYGVVDVVNYGVPQFRKRFILLGSRIDSIHIELPKPTHVPANKSKQIPNSNIWLTVKDAIYNVPPVGNGEKHNDISLHFAPKNTPLNLDRIRNIPKNGGSRISLPEHLQLNCHKKYPNGFRDVYGRMTWEKPSPTLTGGCTNITKGRFIHPDQNRAITLFEASLIQTFPTDYQFFGNAGQIALQIGNAVPVRFGYVMAKSLYDELERLNHEVYKNNSI